jgi:hypothetical protein
MTNPPNLPSQDTIDGVAHFIQAALEMSVSPLFSEDHGRISFEGEIKNGEVELHHITLPNPIIRDAMLIPFRRIWMEREPGNFHKTIKTLKGHAAIYRVEIEECEVQLKKWLRSHTNNWVSKNISLTPKDVIELWINARLAHSGKTSKNGSFTREDFERHANALGMAHFEATFVHAIQAVGAGFLTLLRIAQRTFKEIWAPLGVMPIFAFDNISEVGEQVSYNGVRLTRSSPGIIIEQEDIPARLLRLLGRDTFASLDGFLRLLNMPLPFLADLLLKAKGFDAFLVLLLLCLNPHKFARIMTL